MSFSDRLKEIRRARNLTQKKLAEMIDVSPNSISNYENNVSFPDENILRLLFIALQCEPNDLFEAAKKSTNAYVDGLSNEKNDLIKLVASLNEDAIPAIISLVESAKKLREEKTD